MKAYHSQRHRRPPRGIVCLGLGAAILTGAGALARRDVTGTEVRIFRWANGLPDGAFRAIWVPMQYGTFGTVPALAGLALARRRLRLAGALATGGTAAWILAKVVKPAVGRGRPAALLADVHQRGHEEDDLGFPSGHAAVAAALTSAIWPFSPSGGQIVCATLSGFVPFARLYVGAHLPLDVIGGSALGLAVGCLTNIVLGADQE